MSNPFANWTQADVHAHNARVKRENQINGWAVDCEADLHLDILEACKRRGWIALHGAMCTSTHRTPGEWDFIVLADKGRVFLIECKSKTGKLSPEQYAMHHWAASLGHEPAVVRSLEEFEQLIAKV